MGPASSSANASIDVKVPPDDFDDGERDEDAKPDGEVAGEQQVADDGGALIGDDQLLKKFAVIPPAGGRAPPGNPSEKKDQVIEPDDTHDQVGHLDSAHQHDDRDDGDEAAEDARQDPVLSRAARCCVGDADRLAAFAEAAANAEHEIEERFVGSRANVADRLVSHRYPPARGLKDAEEAAVFFLLRGGIFA